jgi:hypothetical protein
VVLAYDAVTGQRGWVARAATASRSTVAVDVALSPGGDMLYMLAITPQGDYSNCGVVLVAFETGTGTERWRMEHREPAACTYPAHVEPGLIRDAQGNLAERVYVSGWARNEGFGTGTFVLAQNVLPDGSLGSRAWEQRFTGFSGSGAAGGALALSPDGRMLYQGAAAGGPPRETFTVLAYRADTGELVWEQHYRPPRKDVGLAVVDLVVSSDGGRVFGIANGRVGPNAGRLGVYTLAYEATTGAPLWNQEYGRASADYAVGQEGTIVVSPDGGRVFATAMLFEDGFFGWVAIAYDAASGRREWVVESRDPVPELNPAGIIRYVPAIAASPSGDLVFVTGPRGQKAAMQAGTAAYDAATGTQRWMALYGQTSAYPSTVAVSPDGTRVFVAAKVNTLGGSVETGRFTWDLTTLAYATT